MNILSITVLAFVTYKLINLTHRLNQGVKILTIILIGMVIFTLFGKYLLPVIVLLVDLYLFGLVAAFIYGAVSTLYNELAEKE